MYSLPLQTHLHQNVQDLLLLVPSSAPKFFSSENSNRALQVRGNVTYNKGRQEQLSRIRVFKTSSAGVKGATPPNHSVDFPNTQWLYKKIFLTMIILLLLIKVIIIIIIIIMIIIIVTVIVWKNDDDKSSKDQNNYYNDNKIICHIIYLVTSDVDSNVRTKIWRSFSSYELHLSDKMLR